MPLSITNPSSDEESSTDDEVLSLPSSENFEDAGFEDVGFDEVISLPGSEYSDDSEEEEVIAPPPPMTPPMPAVALGPDSFTTPVNARIQPREECTPAEFHHNKAPIVFQRNLAAKRLKRALFTQEEYDATIDVLDQKEAIIDDQKREYFTRSKAARLSV